MPSLIPDVSTFERRLEGLPVVKHRAREVVLTAGSKTGALLFLRSGAVEVVKDGVQIASVNAPGSVFGEQAVLLDQPHTADVRTLEQSEFYVADASAILAGDPTVASTSPRSLRDGSTLPTDGLSRLSANYKPASLPA
jgi:CRP/FNR family cyclic AMP-dependent transcriptional regulator